MSANQLKEAATGQVAARAEPKDIAGMLSSPKMKQQMALAMPKHMTADRMMRIALTEVRKVPALGQCNIESFMGAIMQCAQLGLEPGSALGHAYLLPFGNGKAKDGKSNCQLIIGYRGMIDLARRSGQIVSLTARTVHENDTFKYEFGLEETMHHVPADGDRGKMTHVYAVAKLKGGGVQFDVMSRADVDKVRSTSKAGTNGPWVTHFEEMSKKTVIRRLFKYLPVSIEIQQAVTLDERAEAGIDQDNASVLTGDYSVVDDQQEAGEQVDQATGEIKPAEEINLE